MRNLLTLCATVALLGAANPSAAGEHEYSTGVSPESMEALSNIFDLPGDPPPPITSIEIMRKGTSVQTIIVDISVLSDDDCLSVFVEQNTYIEGSFFKYVWCQESNYDPDVPNLRTLQLDVYFYGTNLEYLQQNNLECEVSDIVPLGAYNKLCIDAVIPPK